MDEKRTAQTWNQEIKDDVVDLYGRTGVDYFWSLADEASLQMMQIADAAKVMKGLSSRIRSMSWHRKPESTRKP